MLNTLIKLIDGQSLINQVVAYLPNIFSAIVSLIILWIVNRAIQKTLSATLTRMKVARQLQGLILRAARLVLVIFAILTVADQLKFNITSLLAGVGVMGLALSFAAKDTISNIISGITIIIDGLFKEDDWICMGEMHATVTDIRMRTTVLTTFDNETVVVPNQQLAQERIVNYTMTPKSRVKVSIGIAYKEDISRARNIMLETVSRDDRILTDPKPVVIVNGLGASSVSMQLRFWTEDPLLNYALMWEYTEKCKIALDREGIEIPFPHMQLFLEKTKGLQLLAAGKGADN